MAEHHVNPLRYIASNTLTAIALALFLFVGLIHILWTWRTGFKGMLSMTIGLFAFSLGIAMRFGLNHDPTNRGIYIVEYLFVILSPCAFIASDYVLLGRLARYLDATHYLIVPAKRITLIFVLSDVTTFLIQAAGGGLTISDNLATSKNGQNVFVAGLALQLASFFIFTLVYLYFLISVKTKSPEIWAKDADKPWYRDWRSLASVLIVSCIGILVRSVYRTIELSQGYSGYLATHEVFFYTLDTLPLFIAVAVYVPFWPGFYIPRSPSASSVKEKEEA